MLKDKKTGLNKVFDTIDGHDGNGQPGEDWKLRSSMIQLRSLGPVPSSVDENFWSPHLPGEIGMIKLQQGLDDLGWRTFKGCQEHEVKEFQGFHS